MLPRREDPSITGPPSKPQPIEQSMRNLADLATGLFSCWTKCSDVYPQFDRSVSIIANLQVVRAASRPLKRSLIYGETFRRSKNPLGRQMTRRNRGSPSRVRDARPLPSKPTRAPTVTSSHRKKQLNTGPTAEIITGTERTPTNPLGVRDVLLVRYIEAEDFCCMTARLIPQAMRPQVA